VRGATCLVLGSVVRVSCVAFVFSGLSPAARGFVLLLWTKEGANHMRAALFSYVRERDALRCRVGGRPGDPRSDPVIMAYLVPEQWRPRG
jgi:hypothetical protein